MSSGVTRLTVDLKDDSLNSMSISLICLHTADQGAVYVNPQYVTFVAKSPVKGGGTVVGLIADDLGCEVVESVDEVANLILSMKEESEKCQNEKAHGEQDGWRVQNVVNTAELDSGSCPQSRDCSGSRPETAGDSGSGTRPGGFSRKQTRKAKPRRCGSSTSGCSGQFTGKAQEGNNERRRDNYNKEEL